MKKTKRYYVVIFDKKWLEGLLGSEHDELSEAQKALNDAKEMGGIYDVKEGRFVQLKETRTTDYGVGAPLRPTRTEVKEDEE